MLSRAKPAPKPVVAGALLSVRGSWPTLLRMRCSSSCSTRASRHSPESASRPSPQRASSAPSAKPKRAKNPYLNQRAPKVERRRAYGSPASPAGRSARRSARRRGLRAALENLASAAGRFARAPGSAQSRLAGHPLVRCTIEHQGNLRARGVKGVQGRYPYWRPGRLCSNQLYRYQVSAQTRSCWRGLRKAQPFRKPL